MGGKPVGRRAGGHNRGFWHRKNRGWYTTQGAANIPLCAETGEHLTAPEQEAEAEKAYARWLLSDKPTKQGRRTGGSNKGYWYRKNRGWYTTEGQLKVPLLDKAGEHLKDPQTPDEVLKDAYARYRLGIQERMKREAIGDTALIARICQDYLDHAKASNRPSTFEKRGEYLFDFCYGLPAKFWDYGRGRQVSKPSDDDYIHDGYGDRAVGQLIPMDVQRWIDKHPTWGKGTRRIAIQGLKAGLQLCCCDGTHYQESDSGLQGWHRRKANHVLYSRDGGGIVQEFVPGSGDSNSGLHQNWGTLRERVRQTDRSACGRNAKGDGMEVLARRKQKPQASHDLCRTGDCRDRATPDETIPARHPISERAGKTLEQ